MSSATLRLVSSRPNRIRDRPQLEHFGPAAVTAVLGREVELEVQVNGSCIRHWARLAVAGGYRPEVGDLVLAITTRDDSYAIAVLEGQGPTVLDAPGDLELRAPHGTIRILGADGCDIEAPNVRLAADSVELAGGTLHEQFDTVRRRIAGMLEVRAKEMTTVIADTYRLIARRVLNRGEDSVTIDGPSIKLG